MKAYETPEIELIRFQSEDVLGPSTILLEEDETRPAFRNIF